MVERLRARDGDKCWLCARPLKMTATKQSRRISIEHLHPRSLGGGDEIDNLVLCHGHCNRHLRDHPREKKIKIQAKWLRETARVLKKARKRKAKQPPTPVTV